MEFVDKQALGQNSGPSVTKYWVGFTFSGYDGGVFGTAVFCTADKRQSTGDEWWDERHETTQRVKGKTFLERNKVLISSNSEKKKGTSPGLGGGLDATVNTFIRFLEI